MQAGQVLTIKTYLENDRVVLAVHDEGEGIKPEVMEKLGAPFFTTKPKGTGLGLVVCYGIATRHNAVIDVKSEPGNTTFFVRFRLPADFANVPG
jgi:signal transduction histidine kinase